MHFQIRFNQKQTAERRVQSAIDFTGDPGKTLQEPKEDADINILMKRFGVKDGSALPYFTSPKAMYGVDFSEFPTDPQAIADMMHEGQLAFMRLPADLRQRYQTPEALFKFMEQPDNYEEAVKLGLLERRQKAQESPLDRLVNKLDTLVSSSTSSDKEPLVPTSNSSKEK